jgi:hypothetical protein
MADHAITLIQRPTGAEGAERGESLGIVIRTSERNGRWIARPAYDGHLESPDEWPGLANEGDTQRVWVGTSETEVVMTAMNFLRTLYDVKQG